MMVSVASPSSLLNPSLSGEGVVLIGVLCFDDLLCFLVFFLLSFFSADVGWTVETMRQSRSSCHRKCWDSAAAAAGGGERGRMEMGGRGIGVKGRVEGSLDLHDWKDNGKSRDHRILNSLPIGED
ncbi:hypothetical protein Scep_000762 [Stephania cephalantha]|uniref:Uncharacterized protein n=1 Tax=Stephania cephalantha TaxID=152367 RepID=A0AAP0L792_9MAGN